MTGYVPNDGYTENGYIQAIPNLYGELRFTYRPLTAEQRTRLITENEKVDNHKAAYNTSRVVANKLKSWDLKNQDEVVTITPQHLLQLKPSLHDKLIAIVMGLVPSDPDPKAAPEQVEQSLADELEANERGVCVGAAASERDAKN